MEKAPEHRLKVSAALAVLAAGGLAAIGANWQPSHEGKVLVPGIPAAQNCLAGVDPNWTEADIYPGDLIADPYWVAMRARHRWKMSVSPDGSIVAIGDSMFNYLDLGSVPHLVNLGIGGETFRKLMLRMYDLDSKGNPSLLHRAGGVWSLTSINDAIDVRNGLTQRERAATMMPIYDKYVAWVSGPHVVFCPVMVDARKFSVPSNTDYVAPLARHIMTNYRHLPNVKTIDLNPIVAPHGTLLPRYDRGDGQHGSEHFQALVIEHGMQANRSLSVYR